MSNFPAAVRGGGGCPFAPLQYLLPDSHVRAFADDVGMVVGELEQDFGVIHKVFKEFECMSGMELNIPKTICIPLWENGVEECKNNNAFRDAGWGNVKVTTHSTYLGFSSGPGKENSSWDNPLQKFNNRILWHCSLWYKILAWQPRYQPAQA